MPTRIPDTRSNNSAQTRRRPSALFLAGLFAITAAVLEAPAAEGVSLPMQEESQRQAPAGAPGETAWAPGREGTLISGLDGGLYQPYAVSVIERVQRALNTAGLYSGAVNGVLDRPTMEALASFQRANDLAPSGVPSPRTRARLFSAES